MGVRHNPIQNSKAGQAIFLLSLLAFSTLPAWGGDRRDGGHGGGHLSEHDRKVKEAQAAYDAAKAKTKLLQDAKSHLDDDDKYSGDCTAACLPRPSSDGGGGGGTGQNQDGGNTQDQGGGVAPTPGQDQNQGGNTNQGGKPAGKPNQGWGGWGGGSRDPYDPQGAAGSCFISDYRNTDVGRENEENFFKKIRQQPDSPCLLLYNSHVRANSSCAAAIKNCGEVQKAKDGKQIDIDLKVAISAEKDAKADLDAANNADDDSTNTNTTNNNCQWCANHETNTWDRVIAGIGAVSPIISASINAGAYASGMRTWAGVQNNATNQCYSTAVTLGLAPGCTGISTPPSYGLGGAGVGIYGNTGYPGGAGLGTGGVVGIAGGVFGSFGGGTGGFGSPYGGGAYGTGGYGGVGYGGVGGYGGIGGAYGGAGYGGVGGYGTGGYGVGGYGGGGYGTGGYGVGGYGVGGYGGGGYGTGGYGVGGYNNYPSSYGYPAGYGGYGGGGVPYYTNPTLTGLRNQDAAQDQQIYQGVGSSYYNLGNTMNPGVPSGYYGYPGNTGYPANTGGTTGVPALPW